jgi:hypothetical protein
MSEPSKLSDENVVFPPADVCTFCRRMLERWAKSGVGLKAGPSGHFIWPGQAERIAGQLAAIEAGRRA